MNDPQTTAAPQTTVQALRNPMNTDLTTVNMFSAQGFALAQRIAQAYQTANAVPAAFRAYITKREKRGNDYFDVEVENPAALGNCIVAIETAQAVGMSITAVMQNANVIEGRLSWSGKFVIAAINASRRFSPMRFRTTNKGVITAIYHEKGTWNKEARRYNMIEKTIEVENIECVAWAYVMEGGRRTDEVIEGVPVSIKMAVEEGWYAKPGSKWQTEMKHLMLQYRAGSFFGNIHAPDVVMGMGRTSEELDDMRNTLDATTAPDGSIQVDIDQLRQRAPMTEQAAMKTQHDAQDIEVKDVQAASAAQTEGAAAEQQPPGSADQADESLPYDKVLLQINEAKDIDVLDVAADFIRDIADESQRGELTKAYQARRLSLTSQQQQPRRTRSAPISAE